MFRFLLTLVSVKNLDVEASVWSSFEERGGEFNKVILCSAIQVMLIGHERFDVHNVIYIESYAPILGMYCFEILILIMLFIINFTRYAHVLPTTRLRFGCWSID